MFKPEIMIQIKLKRWWDQLGYLTIESGLPGFFSFSFLSFSCLSSAQSGSHLTHIRTTHSPLHTHSGRSATIPMPKHYPHGHTQSPSSSSPLLLLFSLSLSPLLFHNLSPCQSSTCTLTWSLTQTTHPCTDTLTPVHAQADGEMGRVDFAGCWRKGREGGERES